MQLQQTEDTIIQLQETIMQLQKPSYNFKKLPYNPQQQPHKTPPKSRRIQQKFAQKQSAKIAKQAEVNKLILGHYSSRYQDISLFQKEAEEIFSNVDLAEAGKVFSV